MKLLCLIMMIFGLSLLAQPTLTDPVQIVKKCIEQHGGAAKFQEIRDIYAKMDVISYGDGNEIAVTLHEYYRKPDKIRVEMYSDVDPPSIMGWDGQFVRQLLPKDNTIEKTQDQEQIDRIQESIRFIRAMILTNLLAEDSKLEYIKYQPKEGFGIHILSQIPKDGQNEKILLLISDKSYTLLGAQFFLKGNKDAFMVKFKDHQWYKEMYLPMQVEMFQQNKKVMDANLRLAKTNSLENGNSFFVDLLEKARFSKPLQGGDNPRRN